MDRDPLTQDRTVERPILDRRSPFVLDTHELGRRPGTMRKVSMVVPAPEDLATAVIGVPAGSDLDLDLRLEAVMEGVLVSGTARGRTVGECVRCLEPVLGVIDVEFQDLYVYPERAAVAVEDGDDEEDLRELDGDLVDVEPALRDAVVPALPFRPVCSQECQGLCPQCGVRLADLGDAGHQHEVTDPRWGALADMFDDPKES
jgi:uncharacterized protein